jgi:hypothetical protein
MLRGSTLARIRSGIVAKLDEAKTAALHARLAQQLEPAGFDALVKIQISLARERMGPNRSEQFSDGQLKPEAIAAVHAQLVAKSRDGVKTARAAALAVRRDLDQALRQARLIEIGDLVSEAERRDLRPGEVALLEATRGILARLDRQDAQRRIASISEPRTLLATMRAAEADGDVIAAIVAEEQLEARLAAGPTAEDANHDGEQLARLQRQFKVIGEELDAHRAGRLDTDARDVLARLTADVVALEQDVSGAANLQATIDTTGRVLIADAPAMETV